MTEPKKKRAYTKRADKAAKPAATPAVEKKPEVIEAVPTPAPEPEPTPAPVAPQQPINMIVEQKAPPVKILYIDSCIPNNQIPIGSGRYITGSGRIFSVPMEQFEGEFMTPLVMKLIDNRKFVVLSGLSDEQRHQYNCYYDEGEVLKDEGVFDMLFDMPTEQAVDIFSRLCAEHQQLVSTRFMTAYFEKHDNRVTRSKVEALNAASKATDADGLFTPIVKDINEKV